MIPLCTLDEIPIGLGRGFEVAGRQLAVFRSREGAIFALDGRCPHKDGPLADGMLIGDQVVCPLHAFRFRGPSGECDEPGICAISSYPAEVRGNQVFVSVPQS